MARNDILGSWQSVFVVHGFGDPEPYDRQELTFYNDGSAHMHARTLFGRNRDFQWKYVEYGPLGRDYYLVNGLGGPGEVQMASIENGKLVTTDMSLTVFYVRA